MLKPSRMILAVLSLLSCTQAWASENNPVWLTIGGLSYHASGHYNQVNPGIGLEVPIQNNTTFNMGFYKNSYNRKSDYIALNTTFFEGNNYKLGITYGIVSGYGSWEKTDKPVTNTYYRTNEYVITTYEYRDKWKMAVLPTFSLEYHNLGATFMFIPRIMDESTNTFVVQFKVSFAFQKQLHQ